MRGVLTTLIIIGAVIVAPANGQTFQKVTLDIDPLWTGDNPPAALRAIDWDGNGLDDLIIADQSRVVVDLLQNDGTFVRQNLFDLDSTLGVNVIYNSLSIGDFDSNGAPDFFIIQYFPSCCDPPPQIFSQNIYYNQGGTYVPVSLPSSGQLSGSAVATDFDGNGRQDIAIISSEVHVLFNNGGGVFEDKIVSTDSARGFCSEAADFSGDGNPDILTDTFGGRPPIGGPSSAQALIYLNPGSRQSFTTQIADFGTINQYCLTVLDQNNDQALDFANGVAGEGPLYVNIQNGDGSFTGFEVGQTGYVTSMAAGDFNGDGRTDIAVIDPPPGGGYPVNIFYNLADLPATPADTTPPTITSFRLNQQIYHPGDTLVATLCVYDDRDPLLDALLNIQFDGTFNPSMTSIGFNAYEFRTPFPDPLPPEIQALVGQTLFGSGAATDDAGNSATSSPAMAFTIEDTPSTGPSPENPPCDSDFDGITDPVDIEPLAPSDDFSDIGLGGTTTGSIALRGTRTWFIQDAPNPADGVRITATSGSGAARVVGDPPCVPDNNIVIPPNQPADFILTCGSLTVEVLDGTVTVEVVFSGGTAAAQVGAGGKVQFEEDGDELVVRNLGAVDIPISAGALSTILAPGEEVRLGGVVTVAIDVKPGSLPNSINPGSKGKIPVAILSTAGFDASAQVEVSSLRFGRTGGEPSLSHCGKAGEDVNGDGLADLVCHFNTLQAGFQAGNSAGVLTGRTTSGTQIQGSDSVRTVPS